MNAPSRTGWIVESGKTPATFLNKSKSWTLELDQAKVCEDRTDAVIFMGLKKDAHPAQYQLNAAGKPTKRI